ncbi:choloylglycine hydrolase [Propionibacterium australiense]|uniref:choloylglycine hydrolase n=1 Tax=Propionibacterium australiense TaxID=119981 RepID=A0A383S6V1_9ACTN|nr:choloylglycine hydrolase [Propionibacterium australiense]RLP07639.1 linear amide C-N hydrolase [Propionibacterium australiense]RLP08064.1 linear amide C-N hydrolase [Propionibacterium australiense]SYZ33735.1 Linear amide C-N hydrolases, choloylglycine hydrolase family [Propionibacterium australiense]VEH92779.1 Choloylglycine hydrolase [Propionibacterium australiense]
MCTGIRFTDSAGNMYFGRNLDWSTSYGERVVITPKGFPVRWAFLDDAPAAHAVIGMGIVFEDHPLYFDCGNDAGLAVAGLNFPGYAHYEDGPADGRTNVAAYEFPLWVASTFSTVDEVEAALSGTAIVGRPVSEELGVSLLHWIIGDGRRSIVVEYMADGMHVHQDTVDTLANQPTFDWHLENLRSFITATGDLPQPAHWRDAELVPFGSGAGMRGIPGDYYSPSRFVKAAFLNAHYPTKDTETENVARLFHTLGNVSMVDGAALMANGAYERTLYTGCFSARTGTYYYSTYDDPALRRVRLADHADADPGHLLQPEPLSGTAPATIRRVF